MSRPTRNEWLMEVAKATAKRGTCLRRQVGCVLINKHNHIIATGYNGPAYGLPHCTQVQPCLGANYPSGTNLELCEAIHAEQNALLQCRDVFSIEACFTTSSPCITCVKLLLNTSCHVIVFEEEYSQTLPRVIWERTGRVWTQHKS